MNEGGARSAGWRKPRKGVLFMGIPDARVLLSDRHHRRTRSAADISGLAQRSTIYCAIALLDLPSGDYIIYAFWQKLLRLLH